MNGNDENGKKHLGNDIKCLMHAFHLQQNDLAQRTGYSESQLSNILKKEDIDDETLERIAKGLGNGVTPEMIKAYNHKDTISYIINNYSQNIENGGKGTQENIPTTFENGSIQNNNYVAEQAFEFLKENAELKVEIMRLRMKYEADAVESDLKNKK
ncbi:MAG TPA: hypothetical protein DIT04_08615 [Dysgonomonas sp.]|nr:hypothetical protein [Dysgonomonas sp.]